MIRETMQPRENWQKRLEEEGCQYHTIEGQPYWNETAAYRFTSAEVDAIEDATAELQFMCVDHVDSVVYDGTYQGYNFSDTVKEAIQSSWRSSYDGGMLGRFDLGITGPAATRQSIKMFEYNADTPTSLPEAALWQWQWLTDRELPDQYNSIHEKLAQRIRDIAVDRSGDLAKPAHFHFAAMAEAGHEDWGNIHYMMAVAAEVGVSTTSLDIDDLGIADGCNQFLDLSNRKIDLLFKLYPWEWLLQDKFGWNALKSDTQFVEPAWKLLLSTKALLPLLWEKNKGHPLLLESYFERPYQTEGIWASKPTLGREGVNICRVGGGCVADRENPIDPAYDNAGYVWQKWVDVQKFDGQTPVIGSWVIGDTACGMGIREDKNAITGNNSQFVPHYFKD